MAQDDSDILEKLKNFLFGAGALKSAASQGDNSGTAGAVTPPQDTSYLQKAIAATKPQTPDSTPTPAPKMPGKKGAKKKATQNSSTTPATPSNSDILAGTDQ